MPLPVSNTNPKETILPDNTGNLPDSTSFQSRLIPLEDISAKTGVFDGNSLAYLDLNACGTDPRCTNELTTPLNLLDVYEFVFSNNNPVLGQFPIFNPPGPTEKESPFRRIHKVIVPDTYQANTIRSSEDIAASQFRIEASTQVLNLPLVSKTGDPTVNLKIKQAWLNNQEIQYVDLGSVPFSASNNQLGVGLIYFLRNHDRTNLPSNPAPIFDTLPGDLLYSPIRQVFRAVSENQIVTPEGDPTRGIRSQKELLQAVNQGVLRLEDTGRFFNYPILTDALLPEQNTEIYGLYLNALQELPPPPPDAHYALWTSNKKQEYRLLLRFHATGSTLLDLQNQPQSLSEPVFRFSKQEIAEISKLIVTLETTQAQTPSNTLLLENSTPSSQGSWTLRPPFQERYSHLQEGSFILANPTDTRSEYSSSGIWFAKRITENTGLPLSQELEAGLVLSSPPEGWIYQGWVLYQRSPEIWLPTGRFTNPAQKDNLSLYSGFRTGYPFPGEDFIKSAPANTIFPLNLPSTGDSEVAVSLEPIATETQHPFLPLFKAALPKGTPSYTHLKLPPSKPQELQITAELRLETP
ncbi:hypothetical protein COW36_24345 [bacterium (Candidatus Blackallbacteria) CG17_big_fil_post_rev_8_21_14_2_50_48_46]|uniref:Uncharacterized protein n=1 Tax=bacterium (Candidatus Blackallbacteria) CG17_big_fil_post_rev_8_21_14_2_50_48_46 TaxID=2014261 RepID=A0A2M7FX30_9BACT|nr:MAG: hypothetical protein COW64_19285 [bacterium (Candidatus Blackallbacteria) CG18_big_fil_WC_8_21_14_2_50_49_26]PIW13801.1 MAG: hypothetical protein COW36_24345 [bacterium (Candidatus Blackallbacteria) CG17_big_fil_post_rev_8_21_14_2_50_48_46]PIW45027.1 MAG: hypothetical protein COW20_21975 [bacterium (Candidatus Blackallbacteria) CG13_big_fil_rev_8_21_14_2_50_49_14]